MKTIKKLKDLFQRATVNCDNIYIGESKEKAFNYYIAAGRIDDAIETIKIIASHISSKNCGVESCILHELRFLE